jgi:hypothetical protein
MMKTLSYPNYSEYIPEGPSYNLNKWMDAMKNIYVKLHLGANKKQSIDAITNDWGTMEKIDFLNWLKYYESGDQNKYKKAQHSYYVNDDINYFLPNPKSPIPSPIRSINDQIATIPQEAENIVSQKQNEMTADDKRKIIEDTRRKILGRLSSAEKLLSSQHGQFFAGPDFERLLSAIYELKKQIQIVNKTALSAQTIVDLIVRQANILSAQGYNAASQFMVKFAQNTPGDFSMNLGDVPAGGSQPQGGGSLGNNPPDLTQPSGGPEQKEITQDSAVGKFIENLEDSGLTEEDDVDTNVAEDEVDIDNDVLLDQEIVPEGKDDLVVHAQAVPDAAKPIKPAKKPTEDLEVESPAQGNATGITPEDAKRGPDVSQVKNDFDALIDSAFANLTVADVVNKLEDVNKIFRNREISRQLALVDVMLDRLGLAPYFPTLAEATNKSLESNQYCLTRIEDVLSKLRGTMTTGKVDLKNENQQVSPEAKTVQTALKNDEMKEKQRKEVKKQLEDQAALEKVKPEGVVENAPQELTSRPAKIEQQPNKIV